MKELDDGHIEHIMKEAAANFVPSYNPDSWTQMQAKMSAAGMISPKVGKSVYATRILAGLLFLIAFVGGGYYYFSILEDSELTPELVEPQIQDSADNVSLTDSTFIENIETSKENRDATDQFKNINQKLQVSENATTNTSAKVFIVEPQKVIDSPVDKKSGKRSQLINSDQGEDLEYTGEGKAEHTRNFVLLNELEMKQLMPASLFDFKDYELETIVLDSIDSGASQEDYRKFSLSVLASPDFSGTSPSNMRGTGIDIGIMAEYFINRKISINAGLKYGSKKYLVDENFEGYSTRWPVRDVPDEVDGSCTVLDIPINLKYYFYENGNTRMFFNSGITSYVMLTEDYLYKYYDDSKADWAVSVEGENKHFFGLIDLSFGIQKQIGERLYIVGEPFYKIPIQGIGAGKVDLNSSGLYISIKKDF